MILKNKLSILSFKKSELRQAQTNFVLELVKQFPAIFKIDLGQLWSICADELDFLLSTCLRIKSAKIKIRCEGGGYNAGEVNLTDRPGLKENRSSSKDIYWEVATGFNETDRVCMFGKKDYNDKKKIYLNVLDNHPDIIQDKLEIFWEFLNQFVKFRKSSGFDSEGKLPQPLRGGFPFLTLGATDIFLSIGEGNDRSSFSGLQIPKFFNEFSKNFIQDEDREGYGFNDEEKDDDDFESSNEGATRLILKDFDSFDKTMIILNVKKQKVFEDSTQFLKEIREFNRPKKVLKKLQE